MHRSCLDKHFPWSQELGWHHTIHTFIPHSREQTNTQGRGSTVENGHLRGEEHMIQKGCREYSLIPARPHHLLPGPLMESSKTPTRLQHIQKKMGMESNPGAPLKASATFAQSVTTYRDSRQVYKSEAPAMRMTNQVTGQAFKTSAVKFKLVQSKWEKDGSKPCAMGTARLKVQHFRYCGVSTEFLHFFFTAILCP